MPDFMNHEVPVWLEWIKTGVEVGVGVTLCIAFYRKVRDAIVSFRDMASTIDKRWARQRMSNIVSRIDRRNAAAADPAKMVAHVGLLLSTMIVHSLLIIMMFLVAIELMILFSPPPTLTHEPVSIHRFLAGGWPGGVVGFFTGVLLYSPFAAIRVRLRDLWNVEKANKRDLQRLMKLQDRAGVQIKELEARPLSPGDFLGREI